MTFFNNIKDLNQKAERHKKRGNNDFNPYLKILNKNNEVYLHSALFYSFLDPQGDHYQGDVFLEAFLESVGLKEWFSNTSGARVYQELSIFILLVGKSILP